MSPSDRALLVRIAVGFVLAYIFGFEREIRGSSAGDRTFSVVGASATAITAVVARTSPQAIAGVVTGVGFIGGGIVFHSAAGLTKGITTAATVFAVAAVGVVVGYGHLMLGVITSIGLLLTLEIHHIPFLRGLDASRYSGRFEDDHGPSGSDPQPPGRSPQPPGP